MTSSIHDRSLALGMLPVFCDTMVPLRYMKRAGMLRTPNWAAVAVFCSVSTLATRISRSSATASNTGPIALQGAHQGAQKSTMTHSVSFTVSLNSLSLTFLTSPMSSPKTPSRGRIIGVCAKLDGAQHGKSHQMAATRKTRGMT